MKPHGMQVAAHERAPLCCALTCLALAGGSTSLSAAEARAPLMVSAMVLPVARVHLAVAVPQVQVSAADLARGYTDAPRPFLLRVESNSRAGFALDVATLSPWFTAVTLTGLDADVSLGAAGGTVVQRWQGTRSRSFELRARFMLAPGLRAGLYVWPLQVSVRPL